LCARSWFSQWARYTGFKLEEDAPAAAAEPEDTSSSPPRPGPIDNSDIAEGEAEAGLHKLQRCQLEGRDYRLVSDAAWRALHGAYGGGPALPRRVVQDSAGKLSVDVYPLQVTVLRSSAPDDKGLPVIISAKAIAAAPLPHARGCTLPRALETLVASAHALQSHAWP
jgi:ubiquitin carboxyl-terminal hydrolase 4/11/15